MFLASCSSWGCGVGGWGWGWLEGWVDGVGGCWGVGVVGGWVDGGGGGWGVPPHTCTHTHTHTCTCMHGNHGNFMQMATPIGFGEILGIPYDVIHACVHPCACAHGWSAPSHHPHPHPPTPHPLGDPQNLSKFNSTWTNQDISILFEDLKSVETLPPIGGCIIWWVLGWWVGSGQITKNLKIADWIKIIQFCLKIYDL